MAEVCTFWYFVVRVSFRIYAYLFLLQQAEWALILVFS